MAEARWPPPLQGATKSLVGVPHDVSFTHIPAKLQARLRKMEHDAEDAALGAWTGYTNDRDQVLLVILPNRCRVVTASSGQQVWPRDGVRISALTIGLDCVVTVEPTKGKRIRFSADRTEARKEIQAVLTGIATEAVVPELDLSRARVVTLSELPGHRITKVHGVGQGRWGSFGMDCGGEGAEVPWTQRSQTSCLPLIISALTV